MRYRRHSSARSYTDPKVGKINILNGGTDAPLTTRGRRLYYGTLVALACIAIASIAVTWLARH